MAQSSSDSGRSRSPPRQRQEEDANSCLYIGNIDKRLSEDRLRAAFEAHGQLEYCFIVYEPHSGPGSSRGEPKQSRGYGFAKYKNPEDTEKAKEKMQGADLNGRKINVEISKRSRPREPTPGRYLGKKRSSPPRRSYGYRQSYSRSSSRSPKRHRHRHHEKRRHRHYRDRSRSESPYNNNRRRRSSYSRSPRRSPRR